MPKRGQYRKKRRTHVENSTVEEELSQAPKSVVIHWKHVPNRMKHLVAEMRLVMSPFCGIKLNESSKTGLDAYLKMCESYNVTQLMILGTTANENYLKLIQVGTLRTFTFHIVHFALGADIKQAVCPNPSLTSRSYLTQPFVLIRGFHHMQRKQRTYPAQMLSECFASMIPRIRLDEDHTKLAKQIQRRVVLFDIDPVSHILKLRHYNIVQSSKHFVENLHKLSHAPSLLSKELKKLGESLEAKQLQDAETGQTDTPSQSQQHQIK